MRISVASDMDTPVARAVVEELRRRGHEPVVHGALAEGERADWAWACERAARDVAEGDAEQGIVCCWTGTGASIAANKVAGHPGRAVRGRRDGARRAHLERRQRARAQPAQRRRSRCSKRSSTAGSRPRRATTPTTARTSSTSTSWTRREARALRWRLTRTDIVATRGGRAAGARAAHHRRHLERVPGASSCRARTSAIEFERIGEGHSNITYLVTRGERPLRAAPAAAAAAAAVGPRRPARVAHARRDQGTPACAPRARCSRATTSR